MKVGIGLPNPIPNTSGSTLVEWAQRAEQSGFSALATIDRLVYPGFDSLSSLAAAAAVTSRIELLTSILIAPFYDTVLLAKQAASNPSHIAGTFRAGNGGGWARGRLHRSRKGLLESRRSLR